MLRVAGLGAGLALLPRALRAAPESAVDASAATPARRVANSAVYRFRIGAIEAAALVTGYLEGKPEQPFYAPQASAEEFRAALADAGIAGKLRLHFNILLLRVGSEVVLVDAGPGGRQPPHFAPPALLAELGHKPADVSLVLLTHAHFDHIGGLLDAEGRIAFPNARHLCMPEEIDYWTAAKPDFSRLRMKPDGLVKAARRVFDVVPFERIGATTKLPDGIRPLLAPGHTPGHMALRIASGGETLFHIGDLTHHGALLVPHPDWTVASDCNEEQAAATRRAIFAQLAAEGTRVFGCHLPFPGLGRLIARGDGFRWQPEDWDAGV
jgi:glyoxylase-like metal-dependent hydrolase (beta-lactamase superfamily II)